MKHLKYIRICIGCALLLAAFLSPAAPAPGQPESYENPVIPGDHPDPSIICVGKDFWATSTSSEWGPQFPLLHSTDLVNWKQVGDVFAHRPEWATANFWAPEISKFGNRYYVYYVGCQAKGGTLAVAVAIADKPEGPYKDYGPIVSQDVGSIDPVPCTDQIGQRYLVWKEDGNSAKKPTPIWAQRLNDEGTKLIGEPTELIRNTAEWEGALVEGPYVLRHEDWFYLFYSGNGCCGRDCTYGMGVARSHSILGPWEKNPANPILAGNDTWKCPGHGSIISDDKGRYWLLYHAYATSTSVYTGREAMLDEVKFGGDGWPTINSGRGPSVKAPSPFGARQQKREALSFYDHFIGSKLHPGWQWPQDKEPVYKVEVSHLILSGHPDHPTNELAAVLARSTLTGDYKSTAEIESGKLEPGVSAGLAVIGDAHNALGLAVGDGKLTLWSRDKKGLTVSTQVDAPTAPKVFLRVTARNGVDFHFDVSVDAATWTPVGQNLTGMSLPPWDRSIRLALTVDGPGAASAEFDSFRITQSVPIY
jgi:xylan 1,4-beta-xylosidase